MGERNGTVPTEQALSPSVLGVGLDGTLVVVRPFLHHGRPRADIGRTGLPTGPGGVPGMFPVSSLCRYA